jgi:hypothetical protein
VHHITSASIHDISREVALIMRRLRPERVVIIAASHRLPTNTALSIK